jgi:NodT family efflux transporter outer membrane factor (OMF) lipoprotein
MRFPNRPALLAFALLLGGCTTLGPDFARPEVVAPDRYAAGEADAVLIADASRDADWWHALEAPKLDALIASAFEASPTIAEADAALDAARADADATYGRSRPEVDGRASFDRSRVNPASFGFSGLPGATFSRYTLGAAVSYDLDLFGRERREREAADAREEAETYRAEAARLTLAGQIALKASEIAALAKQIETVEAIVADDRETVDLVERGVSAGSAARVDQVRAAAQLAQDEASLPSVRQRLASARHALALLAGQPPGAWPAPEFAIADFSPPAQIPAAVPSSLVRGRPDILAAEAALHEAMANIGVAEARLYPDISLTADFALIALHPEDLFEYSSSGWSFGPQVHIPLFGGDASRSRIREAEAEARLADARYRATVLRAFGEVADALAALANAEDEVQLQQAAVELADENLALARRAYEIGAGDLGDVIDAQRQLSAAHRGEAEALGRRIDAVIRLYAATATTEIEQADPQVAGGPGADGGA